MNLRFVEAFIVVTQLKSFRAAADMLCATQPAISSRIASLEEELGFKLFERSSQAVTLTERGSAILPLAENLLRLSRQMLTAVDGGKALAGTLRVAAMETVVHSWLPDLVARYSSLYPLVTIELTSGVTPVLHESLLRRRVDCVFLGEEISEGFVENCALLEMDVAWVSSPELAIPPNAKFADVSLQKFLCFYQELPVYRSIVRLAEGRQLPHINHFSSLTSIVRLAKLGCGIAPLPLALVADEISGGQLRELDLHPRPLPLQLFGSMRTDVPSPAAKAMIQLAVEFCDQYSREHSASGYARKL